MENKEHYMYFGFLDFLAYYVPGVFVLLFLIVLNWTLEINIQNPGKAVDSLSSEAYVRGTIWTILAIIVPYVLGHLIFPLSYFFGDFFFKSKITKDKNSEDCNCAHIKGGSYCDTESLEFAGCLLKSLQNPTSGFYELMITRFRTLSRFCRAMLFPTILLAISFLLLCLVLFRNGNCLGGVTFILIAVAVSSSFFGVGKRYKRYETRWRNGVCIGSGKLP